MKLTLSEEGEKAFWALITQLGMAMRKDGQMSLLKSISFHRGVKKAMQEHEWEYVMNGLSRDALEVLLRSANELLKSDTLEETANRVGASAERLEDCRLGLMQVKRVLEHKIAGKKANAKN